MELYRKNSEEPQNENWKAKSQREISKIPKVMNTTRQTISKKKINSWLCESKYWIATKNICEENINCIMMQKTNSKIVWLATRSLIHLSSRVTNWSLLRRLFMQICACSILTEPTYVERTFEQSRYAQTLGHDDFRLCA